MTTPNDPMRDLVEEYALGMLGDAERIAFDARLAVDPELQHELAATLETLSALGLSTPAELPAMLKQRVMTQIAATGSIAPAASTASATATMIPFAPRTSAARTPIWLGALLAASLVWIAKLSLDLNGARRDARAALVAENVDRRAVTERDSLIAQLTDPATEMVTLAATGAARPVIKAYLDRARRTMMLSAGRLDTLPVGRAYQVWFIVDGKPVPSVTFRPDSAGRALLRVVSIPAGAVAAAAITQEPEGGSAAPTTPVLFVGKLTTE